MRRRGAIFRTFFIFIIIMAITVHIILSNIATGSEEVKLTLGCYSHVTFSFSNATTLMVDKEGIYILPKEFNLSEIYVHLWLEPDRDLPIMFLYIPRQYVIPHVILPNGSEIVLNRFIIHPWNNIQFLSSPLGGFVEGKEIYDVQNSFEYFVSKNFYSMPNSDHEVIHYASMENLTHLIYRIINQTDSFTMSFYAPSTYTFLNYPRELPIVFDKCFLNLTFSRRNNTVLLTTSKLNEELLGAYRLTYDMKSLKWYSNLKMVDFILSILAIVLLFGFTSVYFFRKERAVRALAVLGLALLLLGIYVDFNINNMYNGYVLLNFYSYFTDGYTNIPSEVMWHVSNAVAEGAQLESGLPKVVNWTGLIGEDLTEMNPELADWAHCGLVGAVLSIKLISEDELIYYDYYDTGLWPVYAGSASLKTSGLNTLTLPELDENREMIIDADITINFLINRENLRGSIFLDDLNLCRFVLKNERGQILLKNFSLPNTYVMPKVDIAYSEKIGWVNQILGVLGVLLILSSSALWLNRGGKHMLKAHILKIKGSKTT